MQKIIRTSAVGRLTKRVQMSYLSEKNKPGHDLIFIRHAESIFNKAC